MLSREQVVGWCARLVDKTTGFPPLETCLAAIPALGSLSDLPPGTRVLVRCDTNVVVRPDGRLENDARLRSLLETLSFGRQRGWVQIIHGHVGTDGRQSLTPIVPHLSRVLQQDVTFIGEWMDDATGEILERAQSAVSRLSPGAIVVLENARRYALERCLWKTQPEGLQTLADRLTRYVNGMRAKLATVHVNEAFAASNRDLSSTLIPLAMDRVALGHHVRRELLGPVTEARRAELIILSGAKLNKLDDLELILERDQVRMILAAGLLALPLMKAVADLERRPFQIGTPGDERNRSRADYISRERIEQARRLVHRMKNQGVELLLPIDFVLDNGKVSRTIPAEDAARDVGPATGEFFAAKLDEFLEHHRAQEAAGKGPTVAFHNGVFGMFEREEFTHGTRAFLGQLRRLHEAGVRVYVGGGEGGTALLRFGGPSWVTHCFTAGTTLLKALGAEPIPCVKALYLASIRSPR